MSGEPIYLSLTTTWTEEPPPDPPDEPGPESEDGSIKMFLDEETNQEKREFCYNTWAYFLIQTNLDGYEVETSWGQVQKISSGKRLWYEEPLLKFAHSKEASLPSDPAGPVGIRWNGKNLGPVLVSGRKVTIPEVGTGLATADYYTSVDVWRIKAGVQPYKVTDDFGWGDSVVTAFSGESVASIDIRFKACPDPDDPDGDPDGDGEDEEGPGPVNVRVVEACGDGDPISGATVVINGKSHYLADGTLRLENVPPRTTLNYVASSPKHTTGTGSQTI